VGNASIVTGEEGVSDGFDPATGATSQIDTLFRRVDRLRARNRRQRQAAVWQASPVCAVTQGAPDRVGPSTREDAGRQRSALAVSWTKSQLDFVSGPSGGESCGDRAGTAATAPQCTSGQTRSRTWVPHGREL
jgi:hypothetical protein